MATEEQTQHNLMFPLGTGQLVSVGQRLTISNRSVTKLSFCIYKYIGSPTGNVNFRIRKVSDNSIIVSKVWGDASALPDTATWEEATFDTPVVINEEVRILCEYNTGSANDKIAFRYQTTDVKANEVHTHLSAGTETYDETNPYDAAYIYTYDTPAVPTVTTQAMTNVAATTATGNGNITALGTPAATQHGHCWNTTGTPTISDSKTENGVPAAVGAFTSNLTSLVSGNHYYVRAYATNGAGTAYGSSVEFTAGQKEYPTDAITRVTSLIHRYDRGTYTLEMSLGEVISDLGISMPMTTPQKVVEKKEESAAVKAIHDKAKADAVVPPSLIKPPAPSTVIIPATPTAPALTEPFTTTTPTAAQAAQYAGMSKAEYDKIILQGKIQKALKEFGVISTPAQLETFKQLHPELKIGAGVPKLGTPEYLAWALGQKK